jgi:hypothetical protein
VSQKYSLPTFPEISISPAKLPLKKGFMFGGAIYLARAVPLLVVVFVRYTNYGVNNFE